MLLLARNVIAHLQALWRPNAACAVAFLPRKGTHTNFLMDPSRGDRFDFAQHLGETMRGAEAQ